MCKQEVWKEGSVKAKSVKVRSVKGRKAIVRLTESWHPEQDLSTGQIIYSVLLFLSKIKLNLNMPNRFNFEVQYTRFSIIIYIWQKKDATWFKQRLGCQHNWSAFLTRTWKWRIFRGLKIMVESFFCLYTRHWGQRTINKHRTISKHYNSPQWIRLNKSMALVCGYLPFQFLSLRFVQNIQKTHIARPILFITMVIDLSKNNRSC